jgi:hypothetical protein
MLEGIEACRKRPLLRPVTEPQKWCTPGRIKAPNEEAHAHPLRLSQEGQIAVTAWYGKAEPTFVDCLALGRRYL